MTFPAIEFNALNFGLLKNIILAIVLGAIAAFMSFRLKFLTKGGSWAAFLLAVPVFGLGGWKWGLPLRALLHGLHRTACRGLPGYAGY